MLSAGILIAGKYRVIRKLGEGAMGSVWLAQNETTEREFAIKVLLPQAAASPSALARFLREAKVCGALRHPSILEIYDAGKAPEIGDAPYLVMERLDGAPLDLVLRQRGAFTMRVAMDIVAQISRGLFLAHAKGIIHRDLKPANVFLHRPGTGALEPKVLDFGISKIVDTTTPQIALTNTAALLGSPLYMSPEQMSGEVELDARSDVHALGTLLWECLTGRAPFSASSYNMLVVEIMKGPRPKLRDVMPSAPPDLAAIVERSFAIEARDRFASAAELADALEAVLTRLGGGVLATRTAALDVLGSIDLASKPPPSPHSSTTGPLSVDPQQPQKTQLSAQSPMAHSASPSVPRSSATSFAETELAAGMERMRGAEAVSAVRTGSPARGRAGRSVGILAGAVGLVAVGGAVAMIRYRTTDAAIPVSGASAAPITPVSSITALAPAQPAPSVMVPPSAATLSPPPVASTTPLASATAAPPPPPPAPPASAAPSPVAHTPPAKRAPTRPSSPPTVKPPRIDQSGL